VRATLDAQIELKQVTQALPVQLQPHEVLQQTLVAAEQTPEFRLLNELRGRLGYQDMAVAVWHAFELRLVGDEAGIGNANLLVRPRANWPFQSSDPLTGSARVRYQQQLANVALLTRELRGALLRIAPSDL
jgi:hypothetical protein